MHIAVHPYLTGMPYRIDALDAALKYICKHEKVWKANARRFNDTISTWDVLHTYGNDYKLIFVGDASMSPYEIVAPGGAVEYFNEEPGAAWLTRISVAAPVKLLCRAAASKARSAGKGGSLRFILVILDHKDLPKKSF